MEFYDLAFPFKLGPLTYAAPEGLQLSPGALVLAELKKSVKRAVVLGKAGPVPGRVADLKEIKSAVPEGVVLGESLVRLLKWMSEYYLSPEGLVLKAMFGAGLFEKRKRKAARPKAAKPHQPLPVQEIEKSRLNEFLKPEGFGVHLLHAPSTAYERSFIRGAVSGQTGVIVLVPELSRIPIYEPFLREEFGERLCVLHGRLTGAQRADVYEKILSGGADIVLGTRLAVFAPFKRVSMLAVAEEESEHYKNEEYARYNARDVAIKRASVEGAKVLLTSICPGAESFANALRGKYRLLRPARKPIRVRLINSRKTPMKTPSISEGLHRGIMSALEKGAGAVIIANRLGHSVPVCEDCGHLEKCPSCGMAMVYHRPRRALRCAWCGHSKTAFEACPRCRGHNIKFLGSGLERFEDELKKLLPDTPVRTESAAREDGPSDARLVIGTKRAIPRKGRGEVLAAGVINPEGAFFHPDFRARERVFRELCYLADRLTEGGTLYIQTSEPALLKNLKTLDYESFIKAELAERKILGYPPFSKTGLIMVEGPIKKLELPALENVEILGPAMRLIKKGEKASVLMVKASSSKELKEAFPAILKGIKAEKITVDIDPV